MNGEAFAFLCCLRSPESTHAYDRVEAALLACARSALSQRGANATVIAVGHRRPDFADALPGLHFHSVSLPPPSLDVPNQDGINLDKGIKRLVALGHALRAGARYVAMLDADDLVGRDLVARIDREDRARGPVSRYLSDGYVLDHANGTFQLKHGLQRFCGSTIVYAASAVDGVFDLSGELRPRSLFEANRDRARLIIDLLGNHQRPIGWLLSQGRPVVRHGGRDVAWVVNNGTNVVGQFGLANGVPLHMSFREQFSLPTPDTGGAVDAATSAASNVPTQLRGLDRLRSVASLVSARVHERRTRALGDPGTAPGVPAHPELPESPEVPK